MDGIVEHDKIPRLVLEVRLYPGPTSGVKVVLDSIKLKYINKYQEFVEWGHLAAKAGVEDGGMFVVARF